MDTSKFDKEITKSNKEIESIKHIMEELSKKFIKEAEKFLQKKAQDLGDKIAKIDHPERTKELGRQGLNKLKPQLEKIVVHQIPEQVNILLDKDEYWLHRQPPPPYPGYQRQFESLDKVIRGILGLVGELFESYEFKLAPDEWRRPDPGRGLNYMGNDVLSPKMEGLLDNYVDHYNRLKDYHSELEQKRKEKARAEAEALWNKE